MPDADFIRFKELKKVYKLGTNQSISAIENITFGISKGELVTVVGPSGCGKTTLLKLLAGLIPLTAGTIEVDGKEVSGPQRNFGMVFQNPVLLKWRNILENVLLPIDVLRYDKKYYRDKAMNLLKMVGLQGFEYKYPRNLSGGMQQRVSVCRALIHDPSLLLMDEPFGALDAFTREEMGTEMLRIWRETEKTIVFVTHSISEAVFLGNRVVILTRRPSVIKEIYKVDLPEPRDVETKYTGVFINAVNHVRAAMELGKER